MLMCLIPDPILRQFHRQKVPFRKPPISLFSHLPASRYRNGFINPKITAIKIIVFKLLPQHDERNETIVKEKPAAAVQSNRQTKENLYRRRRRRFFLLVLRCATFPGLFLAQMRNQKRWGVEVGGQANIAEITNGIRQCFLSSFLHYLERNDRNHVSPRPGQVTRGGENRVTMNRDW